MDDLDKTIRNGRTDEQMMQDRISQHPPAHLMIFTKLGGPYPRQMPDGRVVKDPDTLRQIAHMTDNEVMEWLDIVNDGQVSAQTQALCRILDNPDLTKMVLALPEMTDEEILEWLDNIEGSQPEDIE
jgi:hypothetical protein